jgi:plasmid stabilization system protein ParE
MAGKALEIHAALEELKSLIAWYLERSESRPPNFVAEVDRALALVIQAPDRWPKGQDATRRFVLRRFHVALIYREKENAIQLLAVAHGQRRPLEKATLDHAADYGLSCFSIAAVISFESGVTAGSNR